MKKIELVAGISSSALGFGCASVLGAVDANTSRRAIHCALDCGINHFDLARSYGYGEAERFVGKLLKGRRDEVVICSKFGIRANWKSKLLTPAKPIIRAIRKYSSAALPPKEPVAEKSSLSTADKFHDRVPLNANAMRLSLETSLAQLKTDYLDYFLIHEPLEPIVNIYSLLETATQLKKEGKIRCFGLAFTLDKIAMHDSYLSEFDLLQYNKPLNDIEDKAVAGIKTKQGILFSVMKDSRDVYSPSEKLKKVFNDFPLGVILCSTFNTEHIKQNALLAV